MQTNELLFYRAIKLIKVRKGVCCAYARYLRVCAHVFTHVRVRMCASELGLCVCTYICACFFTYDFLVTKKFCHAQAHSYAPLESQQHAHMRHFPPAGVFVRVRVCKSLTFTRYWGCKRAIMRKRTRILL